MPTLLSLTTVPPAAELIRAALAEHGRPRALHEFWLFTGEGRRRLIERELAEEGWTVRLRSAFKPLVSDLLERREAIERAGPPTAIVVDYPVHPAAAENRFRLEAYPLARLVNRWWPEAAFSFGSPLDGLSYRVHVGRAGVGERWDVLAPNRILPAEGREALQAEGREALPTASREALPDEGRETLTPCGWWRVTAEDGTVERDAPWETDYERIYRLAMDAVAAQPWQGQGPYFDQLRIEVDHDGIEERLPIGHDRLDTAEALHEELYFSLLERFALTAGLPEGSRTLQPGQIVPLVRNVTGGPSTVRVVAGREKPLRSLRGPGRAGRALGPRELADLEEAPSEADAAATLLALPGTRLEGRTPRGRTVHGIWRPGTTPPVVINGGQHANETSGVVGALRAAQALLADEEASLGVVALENPDGYALHRELCAVHPEHMHHAARYSALGDDLEYRSEDAPFESAVRRRLVTESGAQLLINLHGYPAHEWVRPLTGYLPHKFEWWAVPQGFVLIARYQPGLAERAERLLRTVAREVQAALPELVKLNDGQLAAYEAHAGKRLFPSEGSVPLLLTETARPGPAVQVITEYPDETVHGRDFLLAHETQYRAAVSAARSWWVMAGED